MGQSVMGGALGKAEGAEQVNFWLLVETEKETRCFKLLTPKGEGAE